MAINVDKIHSLGSLLTDYEFTVPLFQRSYAWEQKNIDEFWGDLVYLLGTGSKKKHFIGSIVAMEEDNEPLSIIDGQQRLTTFIMLIALIRDKAYGLGADQRTLDTGESLLDPWTMANQYLVRADESATPILTPSPVIKQAFYDSVIRRPEDSKRTTFKEREASTRVLRRAYKQLSEYLDAFVNPDETVKSDCPSQVRALHGLLSALLFRFQLLLVKTTTLEESIGIYMTMNSRGLGLSAGDLVKSLFMKECTGGGGSTGTSRKTPEAIAIEWSTIQESVTERRLDQFLRHYLLAYTPGVFARSTETGMAVLEPLRMAGVFGGFEQLLNRMSSQLGVSRRDAANSLLADVKSKAAIYKNLMNPETHWKSRKTKIDAFFRTRILGLNSLMDSHRVVLLPILDPATKLSEPHRKELLQLVEALAMRWIWAQNNAQILENIFRTCAVELSSSQDTAEKAFHTVASELVNRFPKDDVVRTALEQENDKPAHARYALYRVNEEISNRSGTIPFDGSLHVEHMAPQDWEHWREKIVPKIKDERLARESYNSVIETLGNKNLLEFAINESIQKADWETKVAGKDADELKGYNSSQVNLIHDVRDLNDWTTPLIMSRTKWLADSLLKIWSAEVDPKIETQKQWLKSLGTTRR